MRNTLLFAVALIGTGPVRGQCVVSSFGLDSLQRNVSIDDIIFVPGGLVAVGRPQLIPPAPHFHSSWGPDRGVAVVRTNPAGVQTWYRLLLPTNPDIEMDRHPRVASTPDGGMVVYGDLVHHRTSPSIYTNQYLVKLNGEGLVEWSRIYMMPDSSTFQDRGNRSFMLKALADGTLAWAIDGSMELYHVILDPQGWPMTARAYADPSTYSTQFSWTGSIQPDGSWTRNYHCDTAAAHQWRAGLLSVDPTGTVLWAHHLGHADTLNRVSGSVHCANGDEVISWGNETVHQLARFNAAGQVVWNHHIAGPYQGLRELPNGTILGMNMDHTVAQISSDGATIEHVSTSGLYESISTWETNGDSIALVSLNAGPAHSPRAFLTSDYSALAGGGCGWAPVTPPQPVPAPINPIPVTIGTDTAVIKTWDLSLHDLDNDSLDLSASLSGTPFRVGYGGVYVGSVVNLSTLGSPVATVTLETPALTTITLVEPPPTSIVGNTITWVVPTGVQAIAQWSCIVYTTIAPDPLLIGTPITATLAVTQGNVETDLANNSSAFTTTITSSYDPNDKLVRTSSGLSDTEYYPAEDSWLDYTIRFQNTGNDTAFTVVLTDTLPDLFSVASFTVLGASHPYTYQLSAQGVLRVTFSNILLPDSGTNMAASQGLFAFRIAPDQVPVVGTTITNVADIFFDFNPPIRTPDATVVVTAPTAVAALAPAQAISVFPNPARDRIEVLLPADLEVTGWSIAATDGRLLRHQGLALTRGRLSVPLHGLAPGLHVLQLYSVEGRLRTVRFAVE